MSRAPERSVRRDREPTTVRTRSRVVLFLLALQATGGCAGGPPGDEGPTPEPEAPVDEAGAMADSSLMVPPGYGTLVQDDITVRVRRGDLLIKVTPLEEWIIRLTAPDTYDRLRGLARTHGERAASRAMISDPTLFLVSLFSYEPDVTYQPEDLLLLNRGLRFLPQGIAAITPSWGTQRLAQQETRMAVYAFAEGIDLETDLVVEYQDLRNDVWRERVIPLLRAERGKVRARAGGG